MIIGCPKEVKAQEFRVGLTPNAVKELVLQDHTVFIEKNAGIGSGFTDKNYKDAGAKIISSAEELFHGSEMIVKVKEPQEAERKLLKKDQVLFTYLHLAPDPNQTHDLLASGCTAIAYETVTDQYGGLPLLAPMSEVAGRLAPQVGAWTLQKANGGRGLLIGGVPGVEPANVIIIGGGAAGFFAAINIALNNSKLKILILERGKQGLQKVKISGGGRCNVTHAEFIPSDLCSNSVSYTHLTLPTKRIV